jgi:hypothetical protein
MYKVAHVVVVKGEVWVAHQVLQILHVPRNEVVHSQHFHAFSDESVTKV